MVRFPSRVGFTLLELVVVMALISVIALVTFSGLGSFSQSQPTLNAQKEFLSNLRSVQTEVNNGAGGVAVRSVVVPAVNGSSYTIVNAISPLVTSVVALPVGVKISTSNALQTGICFVNLNSVSYNVAQACTGGDPIGVTNCTSGNNGFLCVNGVVSPLTSFTVTFSGGGVTRSVTVEGSGMIINRMYGQ